MFDLTAAMAMEILDQLLLARISTPKAMSKLEAAVAKLKPKFDASQLHKEKCDTELMCLSYISSLFLFLV